MIVEDQSEVLAFLGSPAAHGGAHPVERFSTHISEVFLAGSTALKLKRAVRLPYADFSTPGLRRHFCAREVEVNRRTAPELYLGLRAITRAADGALEIDGPGAVVDWVVAMRRFEQAALFDRMAEAGQLTPQIMEETALAIARLHRSAEPAAPAALAGAGAGVANIAQVLAVNEAGYAESGVFSDAEQAATTRAFRAALAQHAGRLDRRARAGSIRRCHGDLHLRNICLSEGRPVLFDALEFSETLATVDVLYDLAFLVMDLWHRDLAMLANRVVNRYLDATGDEGDFALLPFFMALRASVRAHVIATAATTAPPGRAAARAHEARAYHALARALLAAAPARIVAVGGLSGSGKTTLAEAIGHRIGAPPGARILASDRLRKAMHGLDPRERLPEAAYAPEVSAQVYRVLVRRAAALAADGVPVLVDAVFDRPERRAAIEIAAADARVPFSGLWLDVPPEVLRARVAARRDSVSDAGPSVLAGQIARGAGEVGWRRLPPAPTPEALVNEAAAALGLAVQGGR